MTNGGFTSIQNIVLKATSAVVEIANLYLEASNKNEVIHLKDVVVKAIDATVRIPLEDSRETNCRNKLLVKGQWYDILESCLMYII